MSIITYSDVDFQVVPFGGLAGRIRDRFGPALAGMYDFTSPEGMYQDASGTTPVTAYDQPIGLALDRRFGLVRGEDESSVSSFLKSEDGTYFETLVSAVGNYGKTYEVTMSVTDTSGGPIVQATGSGGSGTVAISSVGQFRAVFKMTDSGSGAIRIGGLTTSRLAATNIVVRELPGHHLTQSTTPARPRFTAQGARHDGVDDFLQAALADDWTFLHDGSGGTLGVSMRVEPTGAASNKMSGTRTSGTGARVGYSSPSGAGGTGGADVYNGDTLFSSYGPAPAGPFYAFVSTLDATRLETYIDGAPLAGADVEDLSSSPPQFPLRTITSVSGRATDIRRIIAIREAVTDPADIALIDAWLREGA